MPASLRRQLLHRCLAGPAADEPDLGLTTAFGLELGAACAPLLAQRWEEGWHRPLADWRERLGITALVARSPFAGVGAADASTRNQVEVA
jgi:ubiquinone biosynthesis protein Coq4